MVGPYIAIEELKAKNGLQGEIVEIYVEEGAVIASNIGAIFVDPVGYILGFVGESTLVSLGILPNPDSASPTQRTVAPHVPLFLRVIFEPRVAE